jgi:hypothetical protein
MHKYLFDFKREQGNTMSTTKDSNTVFIGKKPVKESNAPLLSAA